MKAFRFLLLGSFLAVAPSAGFCADAVAVPDAPAAPALEARFYTWTGPYAGGFVGTSFANFDTAGGASYDGEGVVGGLYAGYNMQSGPLVYGVEGDIGASDLRAGGFSVATGMPISSDSTAFGSLRARIGVEYDPILLFATGGVAVANKELTFNGASDSRTHVGYTVGAGVEAQVTDAVTSRVEYRYTDTDSRRYELGNTSVSSGFDEHSIRAGLALQF